MGRHDRRRLILLTLCLALTAVPIWWPTAGGGEPALPLAAALDPLPGWQLVRRFPLDPQVLAELQPDDYAFAAYSDGRDLVSLYVGYYASAARVGAAHHPLVCFSGQGWELAPVTRERVRLPTGEVLSLASTTAALDTEKLYLAYWFQAYDEALDNPFRQKLALARKKFFDRRENNAFVRVSVPMAGRSPAECRQVVAAFLRAFYPVFVGYLREGE